VIRGLKAVVSSADAKPGHFYYTQGGEGADLLCCVNTNPGQDNPTLGALYFTNGDPREMHLQPMPTQKLLALLQKVYLRADPSAISGSAFTRTIRPGDLLIKGETPLVCTGIPGRGYAIVDLLKGVIVANNVGQDYLTFSRWSLVTDEPDGTEKLLVEFNTPAE